MIGEAEILRLIREEREKEPGLAETLDLHLALLTARAEMEARVPADWLDRASGRIERGEPALTLEDVELNWRAVGRSARRVCAIAAIYRPELSESLSRLAARFDETAVSAGEVRAFVADYLEDRAPETFAEPELFHFVMNHALHPVLEAYAAVVAPVLPQRWPRGGCPVCAGRPDFAALEGEAGERRLLCARCDAEWTSRRVGCPFCGEDGFARIGYFLTGDGAYRLYVCETCKGYLKTIDLRETWRRRPLPLERILTVGMDIGAAQQGYGVR